MRVGFHDLSQFSVQIERTIRVRLMANITDVLSRKTRTPSHARMGFFDKDSQDIPYVGNLSPQSVALQLQGSQFENPDVFSVELAPMVCQNRLVTEVSAI
jgi:hypothetical protein